MSIYGDDDDIEKTELKSENLVSLEATSCRQISYQLT